MMEDSPVDEEMETCDQSLPSCEHRMRLRPWLESMLDSNQIAGLEWLDDKKTCFKIPWKHRSKKDWDTAHVKVFIEWAKHTGKYHEGDEPDYVAMKTRLRCAFNKAPDIKEVKSLHSLKSAEPYRVYCFIQKPDIEGWKESLAKQLPSSSNVCTVNPTIYQPGNEDDSSSECEFSDDEADVAKPNVEDLKKSSEDSVQRSAARCRDESLKDGMLHLMDCDVNAGGAVTNQNCFDAPSACDAAKLLMSLKSNTKEVAPLVIKPLEPDECGAIQRTVNSTVPMELISHLLAQPKMADVQRMQPVQSYAPARQQPKHRTNGNLGHQLKPNQLMLQQASLHPSQAPAAGITSLKQPPLPDLPEGVTIKLEPLSLESENDVANVLPPVQSAVPVSGMAFASIAAPSLPQIRVRQSAGGLPQAMNNVQAVKCRKSKRLLQMPANVRFPYSAAHRAQTKKKQNTAGVTFSNHGNIMATGVRGSLKQVIMMKETVLCEEMLRMREAYGVPVQRNGEAIQECDKVLIENAGNQNTNYGNGVSIPADAKLTSHDPEASLPVEGRVTADDEPTHSIKIPLAVVETDQDSPTGGAVENGGTQRENEVLDLRISPGLSVVNDQDGSQILDLSIKREGKEAVKSVPGCLTEEGALDLTLKRKNEFGFQATSKHTTIKKGASLMVHAIWDLSKNKDEEASPVQSPALAIDLRQSPDGGTTIKQETLSDGTEDDTEKPALDVEDDKPVEKSDDLVTKKPSQVPTLVTEEEASDDEDFSDDSKADDEDDDDEKQDSMSDEVDDDNDMKLAAKQLLELSNRCHVKYRNVRSDYLIRTANSKDVNGDINLKKASYSGNNWGADLYRKGNPFPNSSMAVRDSSGTRQRLRPWLESQINSGTIKGLEWLDRDKGIFKIPWKHGGKHDWTPDNSRIFMEWAKHTGRYREGIDGEDYATWKTRLRCAFNKAPDIEELKDHTDLNCSEPYRVYRLVPRKELQRFLTPVSNVPQRSEGETTMGPEKQQLPIVVEELDETPEVRYPSDLKSLASTDLLGVHRRDGPSVAVIEHKTFPSNPETGAPENVCVVTTVAATVAEGMQGVETTTALVPHVLVCHGESSLLGDNNDDKCMMSELFGESNPIQLEEPVKSDSSLIQFEETIKREVICSDSVGDFPTIDSMRIELKYGNQTVLQHEFCGPDCCYVGSDEPSDQAVHQNVKKMLFPPRSEIRTHRDEQIMSLLPFMKDGIQISSAAGCIEATRYCKCAIFYVSSTKMHGESVKLKRNEGGVVIFDFAEFRQALDDFRNGTGPKPEPCVHLTFGQTCPLSELNENIVISVTVTNLCAERLLNEVLVLEEHPMSSRHPGYGFGDAAENITMDML